MLNKVKTQTKNFNAYKKFIAPKDFLALKRLAQALPKLKVVHISSTSQGGGVAEMLHSLIPLFNSLGIQSDWYTFSAPIRFFRITKQIHNALQGSPYSLNVQERNYYLRINQKLAQEIDKLKCNILVVHDPQPLLAVSYLKKHPSTKKIIRIHVDLSKPNRKMFNFVSRYFKVFDKIILSSLDYLNPNLDYSKINIFYPAIDPLSLKNKAISASRAKKILEDLGIDTKHPLIVQVSRFDPWKDPLGVIDVYRKVSQKITGLQLAYIGILEAKDDPQAAKILKETKKKAGRDKDIYLFSEVSQLAGYEVDLAVNAFQVYADVILQKSIKEGFGLSVTEAMWKGKPVVAGNVGGIKLQITNGKNGFLVNNKKEAAERVLELLQNPKLRQKIGKQAKKSAKKKFLITRLVYDYLKLFKAIQ